MYLVKGYQYKLTWTKWYTKVYLKESFEFEVSGF